MKTVYKYPLSPANFNNMVFYSFPAGAEFLIVDEQAGQLALWARVDTEAPNESRLLAVVGTGFPLPEEPGHTLRFIDTVQMRSGIVLHVFEMAPQ